MKIPPYFKDKYEWAYHLRGIGCTYKDIGKIMGITREKASCIIRYGKNDK